MIAIIDYDAGNIKSVEKALDYLGYEYVLTSDADTILNADGIILPGVGAFGDAMDKINRYNLPGIIKEAVSRGIPFMGICLGMQLLFEESEETPGVKGLGLLEGNIVRIPDNNGLKVPHMGWNNLILLNNGTLYKGMESPYVYFVHSYYLKAKDPSIVKARTEYGVLIDASVEYKNIFGCQFHPEKSSDTGLTILKNFLELTKR